MKHLFSSISTIAILLSIVSENAFSMEPQEAGGARAPARRTSRPGLTPAQAKLFDDIDALKAQNPGKSTSQLAGAINALMKKAGMDVTLSIEEEEKTETMRVNSSDLPANFHYPTFKDAFSDLEKKLSSYITIAQAFETRYKAQGCSLENLFGLINGHLEKLRLPFVLSFDDSRHRIAFLEYAHNASLPAALAPKPITREDKEVKAAQTAVAAEKLQMESQPEPDESLSSEIGIPELVHISTQVSTTRIQLLVLKAKHTENAQEKEALLREALAVYSNFLDSVAVYERHARNTILAVKQAKTTAFRNSEDIFSMLKDFYASHGRYPEYLSTCSTIRKYLNHAVEDLQFVFGALSSKHKDYAPMKERLLENTRDLFDMCFQEMMGYQRISEEASLQRTNYVEEMRRYRQLFLRFGNDKRSSSYKEMSTILQELTDHPSRHGISPALLATTVGRQLQQAQDTILARHDADMPRHMAFFRSLKDRLGRKQVSLEGLQETHTEIHGFGTHILGRAMTSLSTPEDAFEFYAKYFDALHHNAIDFYDVTKYFLKVFMSLGHYEETLKHINAFKQFYRTVDKEKVFQPLDHLEAVCMALLGNPGKLLEIEQEYRLVVEEREKEESLRVQKQRETLKAIVLKRQAKAEEAEKEKESKRRSAKEPQAVVSPSAPLPFPSSNFGETPESTASSKEAKEARHAQRQEQKAQEQEAQEQEAQEKPLAATAAAPAAADVPPDMGVPFEEFFSLTKQQKRVEREIENNTWNISKERLAAYYESFGCTLRQRGSHTTASLPPYTLVDLPDGALLTVQVDLNAFMPTTASFTFADWESSVPNYLRQQILEARTKIQAYYTRVAALEERSALLPS